MLIVARKGHIASNFVENDERVHHYQRGRTSITGLGLLPGRINETERLVVVVTGRLVLSFFCALEEFIG